MRGRDHGHGAARTGWGEGLRGDACGGTDGPAEVAGSRFVAAAAPGAPGVRREAGERGRVLADAEDEGVVHSQTGALGLGDVEVMALGVRGRVAEVEVVRGVLTRVG